MTSRCNLSIVNKDNKVHPVVFHSHTFTVAELNYNTYDKKLLAIFEAFKIWQHYLEGLAYPIDVVTDYKNPSFPFSPYSYSCGYRHPISRHPLGFP